MSSSTDKGEATTPPIIPSSSTESKLPFPSEPNQDEKLVSADPFKDILMSICGDYNYVPARYRDNRVIPLTSERPVLWGDADFDDFRNLLPPEGATCELCLDSYSTDEDEWCRMLCKCKSSWMHNKCAADKFETGYNGGMANLLKCGTCRDSSYGKQCIQWMNQATHLLNTFLCYDAATTKEECAAKLKEAHELSLDVVGFLVRFGRGAQRNVLVGVAVFNVVTAMYELDCLENDGVPTKLEAGTLCLDTERILGGAPSLHEARILQNMIRVCTSDMEKEEWLDHADEYIQRCKSVVPKHERTLHLFVEIEMLIVKMQRPTRTMSSLIQALQRWSHEDVRSLDAHRCLMVCEELIINSGIRDMGEFFAHGVRLDPNLFDEVAAVRQKQIELDLSDLRSAVLADKTTNQERVKLSEVLWLWGREELTDVSVLECLRIAYKAEQLEAAFEEKFGGGGGMAATVVE